MTETWTRENSCAQLPLLPKLLCSLLPPLGCAFSETCNPHTAVTVHIFELFPLLASLALSLCSQTPHILYLDTDHNTQALSLIIGLCLFSTAAQSKCVSALHSPSLAVAYILWLFLGNCDSHHPSPLCYLLFHCTPPTCLSSGSHVLVLGHHAIILALAEVAFS